MLTQMFNEFEQKMLEYMAAHHAASFYEYHAPLGNSTHLLHIPTMISATDVAKVFNKTEAEIRKFFEQLESKRIGTIIIHKLSDIEPMVFGNITFNFATIGERTDDRKDQNTTWMFDFSETVLQCEILKPTADAWKHSLEILAKKIVD